ncbi:uncharacterized protein LOC123272174 [Cotesia glomerata]|uniref:uncharacterized protein LOC123272174 n=1 Tax=Cotesia glomerata TaxID=32391 RepID=UPI001D027E87|nr:uncharacterized protein LOC123272174 [Cotesia glomerata]
MFIKCGNVCPFSECTTIASACSKIYRRNFLKPDTIGILPATGTYRWSQNQSLKAIKWLILKEREYGYRITQAARGKEQRLPSGIVVDGYFENSRTGKKTVLQFHGCYWHGCPKCYKVNRDRKLNNNYQEIDNMDTRYERTIAISERIRNSGYKLIEEWECDFDLYLTNNPETLIELQNHPLINIEPLNPRDAFFGGRTESFISLYDAKENEKIKYVDVCSLYPYICKIGKFPIGHPKIYIGEECSEIIGPNKDLSKLEGLVKCTILPPQNLYHPVLPCKFHNRLLFTLCRSCAQELKQTNCTHKTKDRFLRGTWVVDEIRKAIQKGYKLLKVYEIWHYKITQYNPEIGIGGIFTDDINTFLKIKTEASGYPKDCITDQQKTQYIAAYEKADGIKLDSEKVELNPGLRSVAKLSLNSLWGKFGQRENLMQTEIVTTRARLMEMFTDSQIEICGFLPVNDKTLYINFIHSKDALKPSRTTNVVIAAYTTAQARLKLYSYLEKLGKRALYCDTDSCIYISSKGLYEPPTGKFLGELTDELEKYGIGSYITSFVTGGPKFYAFTILTPDGSIKEVCKVKGITLNVSTSLKINYKTVKSLVTGERKKPIKIKFDAIRRTCFHAVVTKKEKKKRTHNLRKESLKVNI